MAVKLTVTCSVCGQATIAADAFATWDVEKQEWVLHSTYDNTKCLNEDCEADDSAEWHEEEVSDLQTREQMLINLEKDRGN